MKKLLGFVGFGKMASAISSGILKNKVYRPHQLLVFDVHVTAKQQAKKNKLVVVPNLPTLATKSDILLLAVKPFDMAAVLLEISNYLSPKTLIITIAAGLPLAFYKKYLPHHQIIRTMPNTPAMLGLGITGLFFPNTIKHADKKAVTNIFNAIGKTCLVKSENDLNAVTALSGSGPAFVYSFAQAMIAGGITTGLNKEQATLLTLETLKGALGMLTTGVDPATLIEQVSSKKGTTLAGLAVLKRKKFQQMMTACLQAATKRAQEIAQEALT